MRLDKRVALKHNGAITRETYASKKSSRGSEVHAAATSGLKPSAVFTLWAAEYNGELRVVYAGKEYKVYRTYDLEDERKVELHCEVRLGG